VEGSVEWLEGKEVREQYRPPLAKELPLLESRLSTAGEAQRASTGRIFATLWISRVS
jgi:hypothetical protein